MNNRCKCLSVAVIASILVGVVTAFLTYTAVITVTPAFLWVAFGIAVVALALNYVLAVIGAVGRCERKFMPTVLVGILGTLLTSLVLLAVGFAATSVIGAIITGALLGFLTLIALTAACVILATTWNDCD